MKSKPQQFRFVVITLLLASALLVVTDCAIAGERPFKGRIEGSFVGTPTQDPAIFQTVARAVGQATHVGGFTKVTHDVVNIITGEVDGEFTIMSANGDLLNGVYNGFVIPGAVPGTFTWFLDASFTGGTGRFSNATGDFVFIADGMMRGDYTETFDGTISY